METGSLVQYYLEGWRYGYLLEVKGKRAKVRPVAAYKAGTPRGTWVPLEDVREVQEKEAQPVAVLSATRGRRKKREE